jgi:threonylcarbamoyladenosine tRNA methylthiotransferase MtaB
MYTAKQFRHMAVKLRKLYPDFNLTTDIIVGFPGETEVDFMQTKQMAEDLAFSHIHTFKYSVRSGTRAERMDDQLTEKLKNQRSAIIRKISDNGKQNYLKRMIGQKQRLLTERIGSDGIVRGYGEHYIPVRLKAKDLTRNQFADVIVTGVHDGKEAAAIAQLV